MHHVVVYVSEPSSSGSGSLGVGLVMALIAMVLIVRYWKSILFLLGVGLIALLVVGILEIEPLVTQIIQEVKSTAPPDPAA